MGQVSFFISQLETDVVPGIQMQMLQKNTKTILLLKTGPQAQNIFICLYVTLTPQSAHGAALRKSVGISPFTIVTFFPARVRCWFQNLLYIYMFVSYINSLANPLCAAFRGSFGISPFTIH